MKRNKNISLRGTIYPNSTVKKELRYDKVIRDCELIEENRRLRIGKHIVRVRGYETYFKKHKLNRIISVKIFKVGKRIEVSLKVNVEFEHKERVIDIDIAIDVGTNTLVTSSLGERFEMREVLGYRDRIETLLNERKGVYDNILRNSMNIKIVMLKRKINNILYDTIHKHSSSLSQYNNVIIEEIKLNFFRRNDFVANICGKDSRGNYRSRNSFRSDILMKGWSLLFDMIQYKIKGKVIEVDRFKTSQKCCMCFNVDKESRKGSLYKCVKCKSVMDADTNAAINILSLGSKNKASLRASYLLLRRVGESNLNNEYYFKRIKS